MTLKLILGSSAVQAVTPPSPKPTFKKVCALSFYQVTLFEPHYILHTPVLGTNYFESELIRPPNGSVLISIRTALPFWEGTNSNSK